MAKFITHKKNLSISMGRRFIEFKNGVYETESTPLINKLESFPTFGKDFFKEGATKKSAPKKSE